MKKYKKYSKAQIDSIPFIPLIVMAVCVIALIVFEANNNDTVLEQVIIDIVIAILASYIFAFSLNIRMPLKINNKLVIRRRESQIGNPLSISLLVGNPYRRLTGGIFDVKFTFIYRINDGMKSNIAVAKSVDRIWINKYYRASIELKDMDEIEKSFWKEYLNGAKNQNSIIVIISGASNRFGGNFRFLREFSMRDIIIGEDCIGALNKNINGKPDIKKGRLKSEFDGSHRKSIRHYWKAFNQYYTFIHPENENAIKELLQEVAR